MRVLDESMNIINHCMNVREKMVTSHNYDTLYFDFRVLFSKPNNSCEIILPFEFVKINFY